jgi:peptidoglycan/xylan/chitin deacetylase (PgdA/CDA1 family)
MILALLLAAAPVEIAITVDDLPSHGPDFSGIDRVAIAQRMLAALRKHGVPSVYGFVNGAKLEGHPERKAVLDAWRAAGFPLGNHSWSHPNPNETPLDKYLADIERNEPLLAGYGGPWKVFRYPFLFEGDTPERRTQTAAWLRERGYRKADVSIDFDDWAWSPAWAHCVEKRDEIALGELRHTFLDASVRLLEQYRELGRALAAREIAHVLLLHVGAATADQLDAMLSSYEAAGARWVTLDEAQRDPIYAEDPGFVTKWGWSILDRLSKARDVKLQHKTWWPDETRLEQICR